MNNSIMPRPEYPRPQLVRSEWMNGKERKLFSAEHLSSKIIVPFCMECKLSGIGDVDFCDCVWYRKEIDISGTWLDCGKRVILHIGACDYRTTVYINGKSVGEHFGGMSSFSFDITKHLLEGKNTIVISAEDHTRSGVQPGGKQSPRYGSYGCFYTRTTGIWQTVWLESVPSSYISALKYYPNIENSTVTISAEIKGADGITLTAKASYSGKEVGCASSKVSGGVCYVTVPLTELHLWEAGKGRLYDLEIECGEDKISSYFGMRSVVVGENGVLVINGKKVFQRMILDQGFYPDGIWTAPCASELENDILRSMAMGFNGARLHQKVFEERFLYYCDKHGYLVWEEHGNWGVDLTRSTAWKAYFPEWKEIILRDFNHPAIIGWCPLNETKKEQDPDFPQALVALTKALDPTRAVIDTSGWTHEENCTDIMDWHDYDQNPETFKARYEAVANGALIESHRLRYKISPNFISEYGGIKWDINSNLSNAWGYGNAPQTEEEFLERFRGLTEALMFNPYITGLCYTQLTDIEQETNGLYTYDRQPKFDVNFFKKILDQKAACED